MNILRSLADPPDDDDLIVDDDEDTTLPPRSGCPEFETFDGWYKRDDYDGPEIGAEGPSGESDCAS